ncbi:DNA polymerase IV [Parabacteroides sp. Marseille-P3160]|uniref:DNA polymerase IV n=1 Tax=Parabacteroides sp. Marseille-P3160 TaxID=1917887 RepID=UPI0009BB19CB|nr:DNA polymerase IV [Parabacteroides sp. Marseille-P3160]
MRKIIHIDMDAFYASIEQRDHPEYRGKPLAVGYPGARGVVATASYEARRYGIHSAMPSVTALRKCPHLLFVPAHFEVYKSVSRQIRQIFFDYTDLVEPLSLDEAFLDVTVNHKQMQVATRIAEEIRGRIYKETGLTASAGVSFNKFLAKIASDVKKPDGLFVIKPRNAEPFLEQLPIERFFGIGKVTAERMHQLGIHNGFDLKQHSIEELAAWFGKAGMIYYQHARGIDDRQVEPNRIHKSIGAETTFAEDYDSIDVLKEQLKEIAEDVIRRINKHSFQGRTVTLKIKYADFRTITRSRSFQFPVTDYDSLYKNGTELLADISLTPKVRLIGLTIKNNDLPKLGDAFQLELDFKENWNP